MTRLHSALLSLLPNQARKMRQLEEEREIKDAQTYWVEDDKRLKNATIK